MSVLCHLQNSFREAFEYLQIFCRNELESDFIKHLIILKEVKQVAIGVDLKITQWLSRALIAGKMQMIEQPLCFLMLQNDAVLLQRGFELL